jgi:hypothetical protein
MKILICIAFIGVGFHTYGQGAEDTQRAAMKKLDWLLGEWTGESRIRMGADTHVVKMNETVRSGLDGTVFWINGLGTENNAKVHDAFAVVSYDDKSGKYRWNAWRLPGGGYGETEIRIGEYSFEWDLPVPGGKTRYKAIRNEKGQWIETGEFSSDGKNWYPFMVMTLNPVK